jgi:hypothetical protein
MIDDRLRSEAQRLRRAQALADELRERQAELQQEWRERALLARSSPIELSARRRSGGAPGMSAFPEDVC